MKRSDRAAVRDPARRSLRLQLIQHDVPELSVPTPANSAPSTAANPDEGTVPTASPPPSKKQLLELIEETIEEMIETHVQERVDAAVQKHTEALRSALETQPTTALQAGREESAQPEYSTEPYGQDATEDAPEDVPHDAPTQSTSATTPAATAKAATTKAATTQAAAAPAQQEKERAPEATAGVRVVTRKSISGDAARNDAPPSLARAASPAREQPGLAARCIAHAGQHYRGATEDEVIDAWNAMRERFHLSPENKIVARRALLKWLQQSKNVCASNVHWYGDFVAVRSCSVRVPKSHPASGTDGWFVLFDPNGDAVMREALFSEAFETPNKRYAGAVPRLAKPAWLSEERRAAAAARHGGADLRPFSPETADDLSSQDFFRGRAE